MPVAETGSPAAENPPSGSGKCHISCKKSEMRRIEIFYQNFPKWAALIAMPRCIVCGHNDFWIGVARDGIDF
jgi:hypothetical protein